MVDKKKKRILQHFLCTSWDKPEAGGLRLLLLIPFHPPVFPSHSVTQVTCWSISFAQFLSQSLSIFLQVQEETKTKEAFFEDWPLALTFPVFLHPTQGACEVKSVFSEGPFSWKEMKSAVFTVTQFKTISGSSFPSLVQKQSTASLE